MLAITGYGACENESIQLGVAFEELREQGMHSLVRSTLVRMMVLFAAMQCFPTPSQELVESRQECCLDLQQHLAECMVGTLHEVESWLPYDCLSANAYPSLLSFTATPAFSTTLASSSCL